MIELKHIYKSFDGQPAIQDVSMVFEAGITNLIIGASGSGKTVLLKSIVGLHQIDKGEILYDQTLFNALEFQKRREIRKQTGMLFQGAALFDFATVEENVRFPMDFFTDWSKNEKQKRVDFCLERVNLKGVNKYYPAELSGGMQRRVGIARAIALNPKYLFCDEPNSGLDPQTAILIDELIQKITHEYGITTIINTHDMNSVMGIGEKIFFIYRGKKVWEGTKEEILQSDCRELNDFVFASKMAKRLRSYTESHP